MFGFLIKIGLLLVVAVLAYNYFFGSAEEKAQSSKVFGQVKEVAVSVGELAVSEKDRFNAGKYDDALEKLGGAYKALREGAGKLDKSVLARLGELERRKAALKKEVEAMRKIEAEGAAAGEESARQAQRKAALRQQLEALQRDSDALVQEARKP